MLAISAAGCFDGDRFRPGGATVLVEGRKIVGLESREYAVPNGCERRTYDGTLVPGLVDAHVHLVSDASPGGLERASSLGEQELDEVITQSLVQHAAHGVTTVRDLGDCRYRAVGFRDAGGDGVPRIVAAGPPLTVPGGHCSYLGGAVAGRGAIRAALAERVERGVDLVKVMATGGMLTPETDVMAVQFTAADLRLVVDLAHAEGLPVTAHAHGLAGQWHAIEAGVDGIEHFSCLTPNGPECPDELLSAVASAGTTICPTLGLDDDRFPPLESLPSALRDLVERLELTPTRLRSSRREHMRRARQHGVRIVTGVDAGAAPVKWHGMAALAVLELLLGGFTVAEALATATSVAADACGVGAVTGRIARGHDADLLVVDGDVQRDPEALLRPVSVWVRGFPVPLPRG